MDVDGKIENEKNVSNENNTEVKKRNELNKNMNIEKSEDKSSISRKDENMLRDFKRSSMSIISEVRKRQAYDKPSVKRKKKSEAARRRKSKQRKYGE